MSLIYTKINVFYKYKCVNTVLLLLLLFVKLHIYASNVTVKCYFPDIYGIYMYVRQILVTGWIILHVMAYMMKECFTFRINFFSFA